MQGQHRVVSPGDVTKTPHCHCCSGLTLFLAFDDDELIVRASAVLKSQGPENLSRGRPGLFLAFAVHLAALAGPEADLAVWVFLRATKTR